jgi:large subunit ribosomal protein L34
MLSKGNKRKRHRRHGFLHRMASKAGRKIINRKRSRGRWQLTPKKNFYGSWK